MRGKTVEQKAGGFEDQLSWRGDSALRGGGREGDQAGRLDAQGEGARGAGRHRRVGDDGPDVDRGLGMMRLRKIEIAEDADQDGFGTVAFTVSGDDGGETVHSYEGKIQYAFNMREYGYAHSEVSVVPPPGFTQKHEDTKHNTPTSKFQ